MSDSYYDVAQVCPNGHVATDMAHCYPQHRRPHCEECGEATIIDCPKCQTSIRGYYHVPGVIGGFDYKPPAFCYQCGAPFPWTERKKQAAIDLFLEESMDAEDQRQFRESIEQIAKDTPQAQVAGLRITKLLGKVAQALHPSSGAWLLRSPARR